MSDRPPTGDQQDTRQATDRPATVPVSDAARRLGISPDAVRGRLQRGTLAGEKIGGVWHVAGAALPPDTAPTGQPPVDRQDMTGQRQDTDRAPEFRSDLERNSLVEHLRSENAYLRDALAERSRELAAERERADVLMREALTAGPVADAGEVPEEDAVRTQDAPQTRSPAYVRPDVRLPWWWRWVRRLTEKR